MFLYRFVCRCPRCRLSSRRRPQTFVHAITFEQFLDFFHFWHDSWPWPIDCLIRFWSILVVTLTLNFQGQIWNLLYLSQKWSDCHETKKSKYVVWTQGLKCDHLVWPWPWPWPWVFKVKYRICYISTKSGPIATKRKANISIELLASECDQWIWPWPWPWPLNFQGQIWHWPLTTRMSLTKDFRGQIFK